jgi:hypothetical protein
LNTRSPSARRTPLPKATTRFETPTLAPKLPARLSPWRKKAGGLRGVGSSGRGTRFWICCAGGRCVSLATDNCRVLEHSVVGFNCAKITISVVSGPSKIICRIR